MVNENDYSGYIIDASAYITQLYQSTVADYVIEDENKEHRQVTVASHYLGRVRNISEHYTYLQTLHYNEGFVLAIHHCPRYWQTYALNVLKKESSGNKLHFPDIL